MKAIIIGAGIGGLATAVALRQMGWETIIYEQVSQMKEVGAGLTLWVNALHAAKKLGISTNLESLSLSQLQGGIYDHKGTALSLTSAEELKARFGGVNIAIHRADLQKLLLNKVGEGVVQLDHQLDHFEQDKQKVTAFFTNGQTITGDLLIGADGIHSAIRAQLFPASHPRYAGYTAWRGVTAFDLLKGGGEVWGVGKRFGFVPLTASRVYWFATTNAPADEKKPPNGHKAHLQSLFKSWFNPVEALIQATDETAILHNPIYDIKPLKNWSEGKVTLLGDAAHATTPNLGQGACMALEAAVELADCLQRTVSVEVALWQYQNRRLKRTARVIQQSRRIGQIGQLENKLICNLRNFLLKNILSRNQLKQLEWLLAYQP